MSEQSQARVIVANAGTRELDRLAAELAARGVLELCIRPFVGLGEKWHRALRRVPGIGSLYRNTVGRRQLPAGLSPEKILEAASVWEFLGALGTRAPFGLSRSELWNKVTRLRDSSLARRAACHAGEATIFLSGSCVARAGFEVVHSVGGVAVLNFQMAHHRYVQKLLTEEMEFQPEFASTLRPYLSSSALNYTLDAEIELADHILVGSSFAKSSFVAENVREDKVSPISYGTDLSMFRPRAEKSFAKEMHVLFVGQISQLKGISYLLDAYKRIKGSSTRLTLVGNFVGSTEPFCEHQSEFCHVPHAPYSAMSEIFQSADVLVFPTLADGMGLVVLEAMASGLPVVVTPNGPGDLVRDGVDGFVVPIRDSDAIAERLERLRSNPELRVSMGQSARVRAEQFSWEVYARRAADLVLSLDDYSRSRLKPASLERL